jgi:2-C-methyl-D-erythritol 2,4-cyclodiphosphate synthase
MKYRIGIGYDIHRLVKGRKLFLGGMNIPYEKGLLGHSDGDVILHAICDSLLGAMGEKDLGEFFSDKDPKYKGISSIEILKYVNNLLKKKDYKVDNIDTVVIARRPYLSPFKSKISEKISKILKIDKDSINIKAKTDQRLGEIGKGKAIACYAVCLVVKE